jgi:hypothetical protein
VATGLAAGAAGKLWLASGWYPSCGKPESGAIEFRIVLGTVSRDGMWTDHSAFLPELAPNAYKDVELEAALGFVFLRLRIHDGSTPEATHWYRLTEAGATELGTTSDIGHMLVVDSEHVFLANPLGSQITHRLDGGHLVALPSPLLLPSGVLSRGGPEVWLWNPGLSTELLDGTNKPKASDFHTIYRFDGSAFQPVDFHVDPKHASWVPVALVPRGNGKASLLGVASDPLDGESGQKISLVARQLDGPELKGEDVVYGPAECITGNYDEQCNQLASKHLRVLDDGTAITQDSDASGLLSMIPASAVPK